MSTYVLVHGAWHGSWCWRWVSELLEQKNHVVVTPTLTGVGEKAHLVSRHITLETCIEDVAAVIADNELHDVILVGHSFGGALISSVAERFPGRIKQLVYLDAAILENGESMFSRMSDEVVQSRLEQAEKSSNGLTLPIPDAQNLGIESDDIWANVCKLLSPHPVSTYTSKLTLQCKPGKGFPVVYIQCKQPEYTPLNWAKARAQSYGWPIITMDTGHDAMITQPVYLHEILTEYA